MMEKGQEIKELKVKFNDAAINQEDIVNQKLEDTKEKESKSGPVLSQEDLSVDDPHIDFIFGDQNGSLEIAI